VGLGPQPIETEEGWLYYLSWCANHCSGSIYWLGLALLDLDNPACVLHYSDEWVFGPREPYERVGDVPDVTFPCGAVVDSGQLYFYYGAADTTVCLATAKLRELLDYLRGTPAPTPGG
jgi:beta-1,4-mannooligosaccharide/beta-1,4-mannosyl-N-acetylglucosamine phosphorylase